MPDSITAAAAPTDDVHADVHYLARAHAMARFSTCTSRQVGAVLVNKLDAMIAGGFNHSPQGAPTCHDDGCDKDDRNRCQRTVHAELHALLSVAPDIRQGAVLYCTDEPCLACATTISGLGLTAVVYDRSRSRRDHDRVQALFEQTGTVLRQTPTGAGDA